MSATYHIMSAGANMATCFGLDGTDKQNSLARFLQKTAENLLDQTTRFAARKLSQTVRKVDDLSNIIGGPSRAVLIVLVRPNAALEKRLGEKDCHRDINYPRPCANNKRALWLRPIRSTRKSTYTPTRPIVDASTVALGALSRSA